LAEHHFDDSSNVSANQSTRLGQDRIWCSPGHRAIHRREVPRWAAWVGGSRVAITAVVITTESTSRLVGDSETTATANFRLAPDFAI